MKNVLVIGGSAFTGRVFSIMASRNGGFELHVVNRGNHAIMLDRVHEYKCDRHDAEKIPDLVPDIHYDALVDFCAYGPGDIESVVASIGSRISQYIFFSTASVYLPCDGIADENTPLSKMSPLLTDPVSSYIRGKVMLEKELIESCSKAGIKYTILRPVFIYGPFNYAPRESYFIELITKKQAVPIPIDATARFSFVYVLDIADILMMSIGDERAYGEVFNLAAQEAVTYELLFSEFEKLNDEPFEKREVTVAQAERENLPLPFPLSGDALYDGSKFTKRFSYEYTPLSKGMEKTFNTFRSLFIALDENKSNCS